MSDRTSAGIFEAILKILMRRAGEKHPRVKESVRAIARDVANLSRTYDFSPYDLDVDEEKMKVLLGFNLDDMKRGLPR